VLRICAGPPKKPRYVEHRRRGRQVAHARGPSGILLEHQGQFQSLMDVLCTAEGLLMTLNSYKYSLVQVPVTIMINKQIVSEHAAVSASSRWRVSALVLVSRLSVLC
jgi:hypothetical protein